MITNCQRIALAVFFLKFSKIEQKMIFLLQKYGS